MSGVIRDFEKLNQRQLDTLRRRQERELRTIGNIHDDLKSDLKRTNDLELSDIKLQHQGQIRAEAEKRERVLEEMKSNLENSKNLVDKELKNLKEKSVTVKKDTHNQAVLQREQINTENELYLQDINDRFNQHTQKINHEGQKRVDEATEHMQSQFLKNQEFHKNKIDNQTQIHTARFNHDAQTYKNMKELQDSNFKKERSVTNDRQLSEMRKMVDSHSNHLEKRDKNFRKGLKDQDLFFEKKYTNQLSTHNDQFKRIEEQNKKVVEDLKASLTKELSTRANRNDDPFYKFESLKPELKNFEDRVEVQVKVPDYSKQDLQLTINGKEVIISFNRRYSDASKTLDGAINKINKIESFTTRLQSGVFLDAKSVQSSYQDGVMKYVIKRA